MSRMLSYVAAPDDAGQRLDALLAARGLYPSRSAAARAVDDGLVFVNGAEVAKKHPVAPGDTIVYQVEEPVEPGPLRGQPIDLDIRFEDEDLIVLSKQVGLVCHPSVDHDDGTLVNALIYIPRLQAEIRVIQGFHRGKLLVDPSYLQTGIFHMSLSLWLFINAAGVDSRPRGWQSYRESYRRNPCRIFPILLQNRI